MTIANLIPENRDVSTIINRLSNSGIVVIPHYLQENMLQNLRSEFHNILDFEEKNSPYFLKQGKSKSARINGQVNPTQFPITTSVFNSPFMTTIAREYYKPYPYHLHAQLYITHDIDHMDFSSDWHTDLTQSLKFFIYLTDTSKENGAFKYVPGSHREGLYRILYYRQRGIEVFPNYFHEDQVPDRAISIEAPAGSLLIFEAAGMHRAGDLSLGKERMVMRTHTYYKTSRIGRLARRMLRKLPLNMARYRLCEDDKINSLLVNNGVTAEYI